MNSEPLTQSSFRKQLTTTVTIGILALAAISSMTTAWITTTNLYDQMVDDGLQVTKSVAEQSVLSLLYGSGDNAEDAFTAAMGFPSISSVTLFTNEGHTLLTKGHAHTLLSNYKLNSEEAVLAEENGNEWIFSAPVYSEGSIEPTDSAIALALPEQNKRELLGSVVVVKSKDKLERTVIATISNNIAVTMIVAIVLLLIVRRSFTYLTQPLSELSQVMARAEQGDNNAYATLRGPREVHNIGRAFNKMMEALAERDAQLRRHNEQLEYEVAQRTHDLVYARDMAIQANQNKSDFLSRVSHELRTPLQAILGYSDLILEELVSGQESLRHDIDTIITNATHLLTMINSVLDMSKLESGRMQVQLSTVQLQPLINGVIETVTPLLQPNRNRLETVIELQQETVVIDEAKLRQIMLNLLSNAIKFTHDGLIQLVIKISDGLLHIIVNDNGIGIQNDQLEHIFDPFYQIESSLTRRFQGTGLGLAITYQFCRLMGGTIHVISRHQEGSTFEVLIPIPVKEGGNSADS